MSVSPVCGIFVMVLGNKYFLGIEIRHNNGAFIVQVSYYNETQFYPNVNVPRHGELGTGIAPGEDKTNISRLIPSDFETF